MSHIVTVIVGVITFSLTNSASKRADKRNKSRDVKTQYLIEAYNDMTTALRKGFVKDSTLFLDVEEAFSKIQFFGSEEQIQMIDVMIKTFETGAEVNADPLMNSLRNDLRSELGLPMISNPIRHITQGNQGPNPK